MIRTGYSFKTAIGHLSDVQSRLQEIGWTAAPIADRNSTFGFNRWKKLAKKAGLKPVYGVELAVTPSLGEKKPALDYWTFLAISDTADLHEAIYLATSNPGKEPSLTYAQALALPGLIKISGERLLTGMVPVGSENFYGGLSPATSKGLATATAAHPCVASSANVFPREGDRELYRLALGRNAQNQSYPQHILSSDEWIKATSWTVSSARQKEALENRDRILALCNADLNVAALLKPDHPLTLRQMCEEGAEKLGVNLADPIYSARLDRELALIEEKQFADYFYIISDMVKWAKKRMIVGPARGSSCGSLVCYLTEITAIDPIKYNLLFERFIDTTRSDLPDIDLDFSDKRRQLVFDYAEEKYGRDRVARLGTVGMFKPKSALNAVGAALQIPRWRLAKVSDNILQRSSGDSRALQALEDTLADTAAGRDLKHEHPEILLAAGLEGHPNNASQHAAGIVLTEQPVKHYVAIDARTKSAMCDKKDAEDFNLLKIDALGLTQLSIFERTLELIGQPSISGWLEKLPLDDEKAFDVLNKGHFAGVFQFMGGALKSLTKQVEIKSLDDMVAITALARPGPRASGGANTWAKRRIGKEPVAFPHPLFEPYLKDTYGVVIYQEQVMEIGRHIGDLSWDDVTALRKAMSKSLGKEFFNKYGDKWKASAAQKGIPEAVLEKVWDDLCLSGRTRLVNPHPSKGCYRTITLKQLYERGGLGPARGKRQKLLCCIDGRLLPTENWGVTFSGKKQTFKLKTESGNEISATEEHKFLQRNGSYKRLKDLKPGDFVISDAGPVPSERKLKKGTGSGGHNWWHKLKSGAGAPVYSKNKEYLKKMFKNCQHCNEAPYEETHHINLDHEDHRIENLLPVCRKCHKKLHLIYPSPWNSGRGVFPDKVISIEPDRIEEVYDISMPDPHNNFLAEGIVVHNCAYGAWSFNLSHAVAYGIVSYWCCWLKAHHPLEFAAATLDAESDPARQIALLKELAEEGIQYVAVDPEHSVDRWVPVTRGNERVLVGPLTNVKGLGPAAVNEIIASRKSGAELRPALLKRLKAAKTEIDTLFPVADRIRQLHPDLSAINIVTPPKRIIDVQCGVPGDVVVLAVAKKIAPRDENEAVNVAKRNGRVLTGPVASLNLFFADDTDEIFCKIDRYAYERLGKAVVERGRVGKALYAVKGSVPPDFRMIKVKAIKYLGDMDE